MKFRRNKVKREHGILEKALEWLEELSKIPEVTDIIPGVIDVAHSPERGIVYKYETATGCKILLKSGGSIQEAFIVTKKPEIVRKWIEDNSSDPHDSKFRERRLAAEQKQIEEKKRLDNREARQTKDSRNHSKKGTVNKNSTKAKAEEHSILVKRDDLRAGIQDSYQLVEINPRLRDSYVESLASMADFDGPILEETLNSIEIKALENLKLKLESSARIEKGKVTEKPNGGLNKKRQ